MTKFYTTKPPGGTEARTRSLLSRTTGWLFALLVAMVMPAAVEAQVNTYTFASSANTYTPITGGTVLATATSNSGAGSLDDVNYTVTPGAGFSFTYGGVAYTALTLNTNGHISFGTTTTTTSNYTPISGSTGYDGAISAMGRDLNSYFNVSGNTGELRWELLGTSPNRTLVLQWANFRPYSTSTALTPRWLFNFQIRLNETANTIDMDYLCTAPAGTPTAGTAQVGLRGASGVFRTRSVIAGTTNWATSTNGALASTTAAYSTVSTTLPQNLRFTFAPPPCAGTPTGGTVTPASIAGCVGSPGSLISVTGSTSPAFTGLTYQWQEATDDGFGNPNTFSDISGETSTTFTPPAFAVIKYFRRVTTCAAGGGSPTFANTTNYTTFAPGAPSTQSSAIVGTAFFNSATITFTGGTGPAGAGGRVVKINTVNSFTDPSGGVPAANTVYSGGEQVVYNSTGNSVTVTGLDPATTYWVRVWDFSCATSPVYNVTTATGNPNSFATRVPLRYSVARSTGVGYSTIIGAGGSGYTWTTATSTDDQISNAVTLPFTFTYQGQAVTTVKASTNGFLQLITPSNTSENSSGIGNMMGNGTPTGVVAPFWDDLVVLQGSGATAAVLANNMQYRVSGVSPNRIFTAEWRNIKTYISNFATNNTNTAPNFNFQVNLYEGSNNIEFRYGQMQAFSFTPIIDQAFTYSVGLKGYSVSATPVAGETFALQRENTEAFSHHGVTTASTVGANGLRQPVECNSAILFTYNGTYVAPPAPSLGAPTNDEIAGAQSITSETTTPTNLCGSASNPTFSYSSRFATGSTTTGLTTTFTGALAGAVADDDVWFTFTANATNTTINVAGSAGYRAGIEVYQWDGSSDPVKVTNAQAAATANGLLAQLVFPSGAGPTAVPALNIGEVYYVRVFHFLGGERPTGTATVDAGTGAITGVTFAAGSNNGYINSGSVYPRIEVIGNGTGAWLSVGSPTSSTGAPIAGPITIRDGGLGYQAGATVTFDAPGWGVSGDFALFVNSTPVPPANDECANATELAVPTTASWSALQSAFVATTSVEATCNTPSLPQRDVWYVFQATYETATVAVAPKVATTFDPLIQVWSLGAAANATAARAACGTKTLLSPAVCSNLTGGGERDSANLTGLTIGQWYAVRVYHADGGTGDGGSFQIAAYARDVNPPTITGIAYGSGACTATSHTITCTIADNSGVATGVDGPKVVYTVEVGGVVGSPVTIAMANTGGNNWSATIPAQGSGQVVFQIFSQDLATPTPNSATIDGGAYQDAFVQINAGTDKVVNQGSTTILKAQQLNITNTIKITEVMLYGGFGTGYQTTSPPWLIDSDDNVEISNQGNLDIDISNWTLTWVSTSSANASFTFPPGTILPPNTVSVVHIGIGADNAANFYFNTQGGTTPSSGGAFGVYLKSDAGKFVDVVALNGYTFPPALNVGANWSGSVVSASGFAGAVLTGADLNNATNWVQGNPTSMGVYNAGLPAIATNSITWTGGNLSGSLVGGQITTPAFASTGAFTFTASVTDAGCTATDNIIVTVQPPVTPVAAFTASTTTPSTGGTTTTVVFTDNSTNAPDTWTWTFSPSTVTYVGATSASSQSPSVKFNAAGLYTVTLTVANLAGSNTLTKTAYINVSLDYCIPTVANPDVDEDLGLLAIGAWSYGDGALPETENPNAIGGYNDYTAVPGPTIQRTVPTSVAMSIINAGTNTYGTTVNIYIDYNRNGLFDADEIAFAGNSESTDPRTVTGTLTVPFGALNGQTRMRAFVWETSTLGALNPCGAPSWGEFEDYTVTITSPPPCVTPAVGGTLSTTTSAVCGAPADFLGTLSGASGDHIWQFSTFAAPTVWGVIPGVTGTTGTLTANVANSFNIRVVSSAVGCPDATSNTVTFIVNALPSAPTLTSVTPTTITSCASATPVSFVSTPSSGNTIRWYNASSGGTLVASGSPYNFSTINTTQLFAASYNAVTGCVSSRVSATVTNTAQVGSASSFDVRTCGPGASDIVATNGSNGTSLLWYTTATGGSSFFTGSPYNTGNIATTQTYFVESFNAVSGCRSLSRTQVSAVVDNLIPSAPVATGASRCGPGTVTLTASSPYNIQWWDAPVGGTLRANTPSYTTGSLSSSASFYASAVGGTIAGAGLPVPTGSAGTVSFGAGLIFDVNKPLFLYSVDVYPTSVGNFTINIENGATSYASVPVTITAAQINSRVRVNINVNLPIGIGYTIDAVQGTPSVTMRRESTATYPFTNGYLEITDGSLSGFYYFFYNIRTTALGCASATRAVALANIKPLGTWQGTTADWGTTSNWCGNAVPTGASDVLIETGPSITPPVISGPGSVSVRNLSLASGSAVSLINNASFNISGNVSGLGTGGTVDGSGTVLINGSTAQSISGIVSLPNVTVSNPAGTTVGSGSALSITPGNVLQVNAPFTVHPLGDLILRSTPSGTASLGAMATPANFTGQLTQERNLVNAGWHFVGAPLRNVDFNEWSESGQRYSAAAQNNSTLFKYTEGDVTRGIYNGDTTERNGWKIVRNFTDQMNVGDDARGYRAWFRQSFMSSRFAGTLSAKGEPIKGAVASSYTLTPGTWEGGGYNLVSNPYASAISWTAVSANPGNTGTQGGSIYIWNSAQSNYGQYVAGGPSGTVGTSDIIPSSQAFFIKATASGTLNYVESNKVTGSGSFLRTGSTDPYMKLRVTNAAGYYDESILWINDQATVGYDAGRDAYEMRGSYVNLSIMPLAGLNLAIACQPLPTSRQVIPLSFSASSQGNFDIAFLNASSILSSNVRMYLHDNFTGTYHDLATGNYRATINANPLSQGNARFELVLEPNGVTSVKSGAATAQLSAYPNPTVGEDVMIAVNGLTGLTAKVSVTNSIGQVVYTTTMPLVEGAATTKLPVGALAAGMYSVVVENSAAKLRQQVVVK